jgi:hypothetical protein
MDPESAFLINKNSIYWLSEYEAGFEIALHYLYFREPQDSQYISKPDWEQKTGFSWCVPTLDAFT